MGRKSSISLGAYFEVFVDRLVRIGRFKNASEVIQAGLLLLEEEEAKMKVLQHAIQKGIESGLVNDFDPSKHLAKLKSVKTK